ncbi:MAG: hypothetical protein ACFE8E_02680 [Candidatus Hodarchaeota archaeon]
MTGNQKRPLHPLIEKALEMAYEGFEPIEFDDYAVEQLQDMLSEYFGKKELVEAVLELLRLSTVLNEKGCKSASLKILIVVSSAADALESLNREKQTSEE